jgi:hypothetical protein
MGRGRRVSDKLKQIEDWFSEFLDDVRERNKLVPEITYARDRVRWARTALDSAPDTAGCVSMSPVEEEATFALMQLDTLLPLSPRIDFDQAALGISSIVSSTSSHVVEYVGDVGRLDSPAAHMYETQQMEYYRELQRPGRVRDLINRVMPMALSRFDAADQACALAGIASMEDTAAAADLRTLLEGVQGELFDLMRRPKEHMTWPTSIERLVTAASTDTWAHTQLVREQGIHERLRDELSNVLKRRREGELAVLWARVLAHLEAVLSAVESLRRLSKDANQPTTP